MARKEIEIKIEEGRDAGKTFKITEMPVVQADKWVTRLLCLLGKSNKEITDLAFTNGADFLKALSKAEDKDLEPLLDELLECASFMKDGVAVPMKGNMVNSVVDDWRTLMRLKYETMVLILGFLDEGGESTSG